MIIKKTLPQQGLISEKIFNYSSVWEEASWSSAIISDGSKLCHSLTILPSAHWTPIWAGTCND